MENGYVNSIIVNGTETQIQDYGRDQPNGVPVLDTQGKLPTKYIPNNILEACAPVNVVQDGNMHAVTSNAVANALGEWEEVWRQDSDNYILGVKNSLGTWLRIRFAGFIQGNIINGAPILVLPQEWRPVISNPNRCMIGVDTPTTRIGGGLDIETDGEIRVYFHGDTSVDATVTVTGIYCDVFMNIQ